MGQDHNMVECLIDISIDEAVSIDSSIPTLHPEARSSVQDHSSLQDQLSLRDRISASRKRDEDLYNVIEVSLAAKSQCHTVL